MNAAFWRDKRVFLTGHTGFKGSWLSLWLQQAGAQVTGYALTPNTAPNLFEVAKIGSGMNSIIGDIRDINALRSAMASAQPDVVIHMAAQALVRQSYDNPVETYAINVMGTVHVLDAVRSIESVRAVVNVTSDKCYENYEWPWGYRESEPMGGYDPYSNSKGCSELVTAAYRNSYFNCASYEKHGVAIGTARAGNVIGGGDWASDRLIPDVLRAIAQNKAVNIRSPYSIRPWQHVLEPLSGYLVLAERLFTDGIKFAEGWNFGPHDVDAKPVKWIIERMMNAWGPDALWQVDCAPKPHEANYLKLDCSKAHMLLDWQPRWDIGLTIQKIVDWHKAYNVGGDMHQITLAQISAYENSEKLK